VARTDRWWRRALSAAGYTQGSDPESTFQEAGADLNVPDRELGASGTVNVGGYLQQAEYNADWRGLRGVATVDEMFRSDSAVQEAYFHIVQPIKNATWTIEPASDDPLDREVAEFVRRALFEWQKDPFVETIGQILRYLRYGHALFEHTWQIVESDLEFDDPAPDAEHGAQVAKPSRQFLTLNRFAPRLPYTLWKWHAKDGELVSVLQRVWKNESYENIEIPADQLLLFTHEREGDDWTGTSILRAAYKAYYLKTMCEKVLGVAIERGTVGIPTVYIPTEFRDDAEMIGRWENILGNLRAGEQNYVIVTGPKAQGGAGGNDGFTFEIVQPSQGQAIRDTVEFLQYCRAEIKGAVLARFSELGHGSTGARATGEVQSEIWYDALHAIAEYIGEVMHVYIRRLVDANYKVPRYPRLVARDIEARNLEMFATGVSQLVASGAINADKSFREYVRSAMDAPDEDEVDDAGGDMQGPPVTPPDDKDGPQLKPGGGA
jgi:hypothetical protein